MKVWAPDAEAVQVACDGGPVTAAREGDWWSAELPAGVTDYAFLLDGDDAELPDPRSRHQPDGVHGRSRLLEDFTWTDSAWRGAPLPGAILYELHVGTFTPTGTLDSAIEKLDHLVALGVTVVELLPVNAFDGEHGWGYDGVCPSAVHRAYGGPDALRRFVDAAHARGLGVCLDVVPNHLGPSGAYLGTFAPYFTEAHSTPWGAAVNLDQPGSDEVRAWLTWVLQQWFTDFHVDGIRLDAVHELHDSSAVHWLTEARLAVAVLERQLNKALWLVAESDRNDPATVRAVEAGGFGMDGQWTDDVHHALHVALTGETSGYYADFEGFDVLGKALTRAFVHDGTWSAFRKRPHGAPVPPATPGHRFVVCIQNHDQVGNRAVGDRLSATLSTGQLKVGAALLLCSPFTPMLFMGEEFGAKTPFAFFTSFPDPELGDAVRNGRRSEFADHGWNADDIPDPQAESTFTSSQLDWAAQDEELLDWYRALIGLRRSVPALSDGRLDGCDVLSSSEQEWFVLRRGLRPGKAAGAASTATAVALVVNLGDQERTVPVGGSVLLASAEAMATAGHVTLPGHSAVVLDIS